jgi:hypothetical protein
MSSHPTSHDPHDPHGKQSEDEVDYFKVILVGVVSLVIFAFSTVWAAWLLHDETKRVTEASGVSTDPAAIHQQEIGIVDQVPFAYDRRLPRWRKEIDSRLNGYGWVDKGKGIAHIPVSRAMDAIASGALPAGAPK